MTPDERSRRRVFWWSAFIFTIMVAHLIGRTSHKWSLIAFLEARQEVLAAEAMPYQHTDPWAFHARYDAGRALRVMIQDLRTRDIPR